MGEPIRVLHILQRMEAGGTQALLMNIYRKIDRTKVQFDFLVVYKEKQFYDDEIEKMGGHVYKLSFREDLNLPKFQKDLAVFFAQHHEYKIVHCHAYTIGYFCLKAAKKAGIPVRIAHSHNNETVHDIKYLPKLFMQRLFTLNATDLFACSNEAGKYLFKDTDRCVDDITYHGKSVFYDEEGLEKPKTMDFPKKTTSYRLMQEISGKVAAPIDRIKLQYDTELGADASIIIPQYGFEIKF